MARKASAKSVGKSAPAGSNGGIVSSTAVRHSAVPKGVSDTPIVSAERIRTRAYELYAAGEPGTELDHWLRAEREIAGR